MTNDRPGYVPEEWLGQTWLDCGDGLGPRWVDYARGHEQASRDWQAQDPTKSRVVHWIDKTVLIEPEHVGYPHEHGYLPDCPACESKCHCTPGAAECVFEGEHQRPWPHLHAHVESRASDCDGPISSGHLMTMREDELRGWDGTNYFGEIHFHDRVVASVVNTYSLMRGAEATLRVTRPEEGEDYVRLSWHEPTDEGYRATEATICNDESCDLSEDSWRRDHRAEEAGY